MPAKIEKRPYATPVIVRAGVLSKVTPATSIQPPKDQTIERKTHD